MVKAEDRQVEMVVAEDGQLGVLVVEDRHLEQSMHLELVFQRTCYPYFWQVEMVMAEDGQPVVLVVEVGNRRMYEPPFSP